MPDQKRAYLVKLHETGAIMYIHPCSKCGDKNAPFGQAPLVEGKAPRSGKWQSILWFCQICNRANNKESIKQSVLL